jgi:hypothetical protein
MLGRSASVGRRKTPSFVRFGGFWDEMHVLLDNTRRCPSLRECREETLSMAKPLP